MALGSNLGILEILEPGHEPTGPSASKPVVLILNGAVLPWIAAGFLRSSPTPLWGWTHAQAKPGIVAATVAGLRSGVWAALKQVHNEARPLDLDLICWGVEQRNTSF